MDASELTLLVENVIRLLGCTAQNVVVSTGHRTIVAVTSPDEVLVGPQGEHLRALNTIVRRMVEQRHGEAAATFLIDVNGYHEAQMETVRTVARVFAQRARLFKQEVAMEPMSAYERLVVHELFAQDPQIDTRSEGEGRLRHIVLKPVN